MAAELLPVKVGACPGLLGLALLSRQVDVQRLGGEKDAVEGGGAGPCPSGNGQVQGRPPAH